MCVLYSSFSVIFLSVTIEKLVNASNVQWQNDQHELLKKDQLLREDLLQSDLLQREDQLQNVALQREDLQSDLLQREDQHQSEDQLQEKQKEQLQKDEDKILNRLSLLVGDNL
jgi:hypothetical protein